jgi:putative membrane protein
MWSGSFLGMGWMWLGPLLLLLLVGGVVWVVVAASRVRRDDGSPEAILRERYARGEIDTEEYHHRLDQLRS